ncbi:RNA polymerase sigma (SigZ) subunit [Tenacibaculum gallaicum]|uniref:RNA polymerase sigma (SigZ) subunit n=1 Tax=Tenacibaculum gallaicum TaxID=561505 RepID=A0A3E0I9Q7_9FLAO|nr:sigma-70 family RNA polymerase sigma factor [Tenacibaculum gallaicum]REH54875.1 RNA polymerase sigma (SigZ) subunit [Tenacibaculum gallaicum]
MNKDIKILWDDLHQELYRFILSRVKNEEDSKDILQEVFIKALTKIDTLKDTSKLTSWVYQICRNVVLDYFRKKQTSKEGHTDIEFPEEAKEDNTYTKLSTCINGKISNLSEKYKEAILLTSFKDYSQLQLAQDKNISYSGAKSRVQRAKNLLKEDILDCPNVITDDNGKIIDFLE